MNGGYQCPRCGSTALCVSTMPDLLRDGVFLWVIKCGGGHLVTPSETDDFRIEFG